MKKPDDVKINVYPKDNSDGKYCAIVMGWNATSESWYNTGVVIRDKFPVLAFNGALTKATRMGWWK